MITKLIAALSRGIIINENVMYIMIEECKGKFLSLSDLNSLQNYQIINFQNRQNQKTKYLSKSSRIQKNITKKSLNSQFIF